MGASEKHAAAFHPGDGPTPRSAADVLREHMGCRWVVAGPGEGRMTCGSPFPASGRDEPAEHAADMLAAAGLLATAGPFPCCRHCVEDTTHEVGPDQHDVECQRCTTQHDREVAAQALRDAALTWQTGDWASAPRRADRVAERLANGQYVADWLRNRAAQTAAGEVP